MSVGKLSVMGSWTSSFFHLKSKELSRDQPSSSWAEYWVETVLCKKRRCRNDCKLYVGIVSKTRSRILHSSRKNDERKNLFSGYLTHAYLFYVVSLKAHLKGLVDIFLVYQRIILFFSLLLPSLCLSPGNLAPLLVSCVLCPTVFSISNCLNHTLT